MNFVMQNFSLWHLNDIICSSPFTKKKRVKCRAKTIVVETFFFPKICLPIHFILMVYNIAYIVFALSIYGDIFRIYTCKKTMTSSNCMQFIIKQKKRTKYLMAVGTWHAYESQIRCVHTRMWPITSFNIFYTLWFLFYCSLFTKCSNKILNFDRLTN